MSKKKPKKSPRRDDVTVEVKIEGTTRVSVAAILGDGPLGEGDKGRAREVLKAIMDGAELHTKIVGPELSSPVPVAVSTWCA